MVHVLSIEVRKFWWIALSRAHSLYLINKYQRVFCSSLFKTLNNFARHCTNIRAPEKKNKRGKNIVYVHHQTAILVQFSQNINVRAVVNFAHAAEGKSITIMKTEPHTPRWSQNFQRPWRAFGYVRGLIIRRIFLSLNSQIKIEILFTVNHTILLMLVLRI